MTEVGIIIAAAIAIAVVIAIALTAHPFVTSLIPHPFIALTARRFVTRSRPIEAVLQSEEQVVRCLQRWQRVWDWVEGLDDCRLRGGERPASHTRCQSSYCLEAFLRRAGLAKQRQAPAGGERMGRFLCEKDGRG